MAVILHLDTEQAALVSAALEFGVTALEARAARVDPDKVISKAHKLQAIKLEQVQMQMKAAPVARYSAMDDDDRERVDMLFAHWHQAPDPAQKDAILEAIEGHCDACRFKQKTD